MKKIVIKKRTVAIMSLVSCLMSFATFVTLAAGVEARQDIRFKKGNQWQFVFLTVEPSKTADEVFADWPTDAVGMFDPLTFRRYEQWSASGSTEGAGPLPTPMWVRGDAGASGFTRVPGNTVYFFRATNSVTRPVFGTPLAMRTYWHATDTNTPANYVGVSIAEGEQVRLDDYFAGCDAAPSPSRVGGIGAAGPSAQMSFGELMATNGDVFAAEAKCVSDWSGSMFVTPERGIDFGTNDVLASFGVRNDGDTNSFFAVSLKAGEGKGQADPVLDGGLFRWRDVSVSAADNDWHLFSDETSPLRREVKPGETWTVYVAFDRAAAAGRKPGTVFGGILEFVDEGKSKMRTAIPVSATVDDGTWAKSAWPFGLWMATVVFDTASKVEAGRVDHNVPAGGLMTARLPMLVRSATDLRLLQRVEVMADSNGVTRLLAGGVDRPDGWSFVRRISSIQLPTDQPVVEVAEDAADSEFRKSATFSFTVGTDSKVNPYYHARHPLHDGLDSTFKKPAPSGDIFQNYRYEVKPELFSIRNRIVFEWDKDDSTAWSPEKALTGTCSWYLGNLVKEGDLRIKGTFTMQRISDMDVRLK